MGWCVCGQCEGAFLSVVGARVRCPGCGHVLTVETVTLARPGGLDESRPSGKQWLLRIEMHVARAWAEASQRFESSGETWVTGDPDAFADTRDWACAWQQVKALRFGQRIEFVYGVGK